MGSIVCVPSHHEQCRGVNQWGRCELNREVVGSSSLRSRSSFRRWSSAGVEWVCINWKDTATRAI
jgi:hypothetical protein